MSVRLLLRVVRLRSRTPRWSSSPCMWLLTIVADMPRRRAAAEKPPLSTTRTKTVRLVSRSIGRPDYQVWLDDPFASLPIITSACEVHFLTRGGSRRQPTPRHPTGGHHGRP